MTGLVFQAQAVFFDLEKFFVKRENFSGTSRTCGGKLILRVRQNLLEMTGCHDLGLSILGCRFANGDMRRPIQKCEIRLQLDRVTLHFVVESRTLDAEKFCRLLLVAVAFRECLENGVALDVIEALHTRSWRNSALGLLQHGG